MLGVDFRSAPVDVREAFAFSDDSLLEKLSVLHAFVGIHECVILSTCNRTELYLVTESGYDLTPVLEWWHAERKLEHSELFPVMYRRNGDDAVKHLMRVASGLDSMILGEAQILGQIKNSFAMAKNKHTVSRTLVRLFDQAFCVAKEIRTKTAIGQCPVSVACSAVMLARDSVNGLSEKRVLVIGAGKTAELIAKHILSAAPKEVLIANRTFSNAERLADKISGTALPLSDLSKQLKTVDIVIAAVNSKMPLIGFDDVKLLSHQVLFIDLSVPRAISSTVAKHEGMTLYSVDDLEGLIQKNTEARARAAIIAEKIVAQGLTKYEREVKADQADDIICAVRRQAEKMVSSEVEKNLKRLENGGDPSQVLLHFAHSIKNKWLHQPSISLRKASEKGQSDFLGMAESLFGVNLEKEIDEKVN